MGLGTHKYKMTVTPQDFADDFDAYRAAKNKKRIVPNRRKQTKLIKDILASINQKVIDQVVHHNYKFRIPFQIGMISIILNDIPTDKNRLKIDWHRTISMWKKDPQTKIDHKMVYHLNDHTNGKYARFSFQKHYKSSTNMSLYSFIPTGGNKKLLAKAMKEGTVETIQFLRK